MTARLPVLQQAQGPLYKPAAAIRENVSRYGAVAQSATLSQSGRMEMQAIEMLAGEVVTSANLFTGGTAASGPTNWWFALYDANYALIRQSTDQLTAAITNVSLKTLALDSLTVTAIALVSGTTYRFTVAGKGSIAVNDSVIVSNCNVAGYNGTWTVSSLAGGAGTFDADIGTNPAAWASGGTVKLAAGKRTYTIPTSGLYFVAAMVKVSVTLPTWFGFANNATGEPLVAMAPVLAGYSNASLTGSAPATAAAPTARINNFYCYLG